MADLGLIAPLNLELIPNFQNLDADLPRARRGTWRTSTRSARTGARPAGSTTTPPSPSPSTPGPTSSPRPRVWPAATCRCSARRPTCAGIYFWANGIPWTTEDPADLDACEAFIVDEFASHIKAFDSYPGINLTSGNYILSQVWNGDARQGLLSVGDDADKYTWGLGAPVTELWMDNWCIVNGAQNIGRGLQLHELHHGPRQLGDRPGVPRLQHRHQGRRGPRAGRHGIPRHDLLHRRSR